MPPPTTLLELATLEVATATANRDAAQAALKTAQDALAAATASAADIGTQLAALSAEERRQRVALTTSPTEADGIAILETLATLGTWRRMIERRLLDVGLDIEIQDRAITAQQAELTRTTGVLDAATQDLAWQTRQADAAASATLAALREDLAEPPVSTLRADATAMLAAPEYADAATRIETDIPTGLLARARGRGDLQTARSTARRTAADAARSTLADARADVEGPAGTAAQKQLAFDAAAANLRDYVQLGRGRLDTAVGLLAGITTAAPLSAEAIAAIAAADAQASVDLEEARDQRRADVDAKQAALGSARLAAIVTDPDDVESDPAVVAARGDLETATTALTAADTDYTQADRDAVDAWEAAVPDSSWRLLADLTTATAILTDLRDLDPAALGAALDAAVAALVTARFADRRAARTLAHLESAVRERSDKADAATRSDRAQLLSALRGDG